MTPQQFTDKYNGKTVGYPEGKYIGQCLSIVKLYVKECFGINPPPSGSNSAYGYWSNFPDPLGSVFTKVKNTKEAIIERGCIPVWNTNVGRGSGHIEVCTKGGKDDFESFGANWGGIHCHFEKHDFKNIAGWLKPKVYTKPMVTDPATTPAMEELNRILQFVNENKITEGQLREGFAYVKNETVPKLEKKVKALDKKQVEMDKKIVELETKYAQKEELEQSYQSAIKTANSKIIKLAQKSDDMEKERDDWRKRYNDKNVEYNELLVKKNMAKAKIILSDVYKKDLRVLGFLFIFGGVTFISQRFLNASDFWSVLFGGIANYIVFRVREELNKEGYREALKK